MNAEITNKSDSLSPTGLKSSTLISTRQAKPDKSDACRVGFVRLFSFHIMVSMAARFTPIWKNIGSQMQLVLS